MVNRRHLTLIAAAAACLFVATAASADPINAFSATAAPSAVKPSSSTSFTVKLTNDPASPDRAQRAKIGIPSGFSVAAASVQATTTAVGSCGVSTWVADGELIAAQKMNLKRPGTDATALCPGATLTVTFTATSGAAEGTNAWTSELLRSANDAFTLIGNQPAVVVDGTAPAVALTGKPNNPSNDASPSFVFSSGELATFTCKLDGGAFEQCTSPRAYTALVGGSHTFTVRATDAAGNTGEASYSWTVDTVAPTASIATRPSNPSNDTSPGFTFSASEASTFDCKLDAAAFAACTSPRGYTGVPDGSHTFTVRATDAAGNTGVATYTWDIDTVAPAVAITGQPTNPSNVKSPSFSFTAEQNAAVECKLDQGAVESCSSPKTYSNLGDGGHTFAVTAKDAAGNTATKTYSWSVDTAAPTTTI
ncbi:MAG TPA: Ig-like domain-containing protein, partial [Solirubrobacterales bacterium]|nr:Ig-like domain-containing protein [Solirubrobacterales bacterium]